MVMYTHQFGGVSGGLSVLVAERQIYPVWERGGSLGDLWVKAEIGFVVNSTFQVQVFPSFLYFDHWKKSGSHPNFVIFLYVYPVDIVCCCD